MNLRSSNKKLTHTQNGANTESSCKGIDEHVQKGDCTNEIKKKEIRNEQVRNANKNEKNCNIGNTGTHFEEGEGDKNVEQKEIPLDLHGIDNLAAESEKGIPLCMTTKDDTWGSGYCEGYPHENNKEDSNAQKVAEVCKTKRYTDNHAADGGAPYDWSESRKAGQDNFLRGEVEKVEKMTEKATQKITQKKTTKNTAKRRVEQEEVVPSTRLENQANPTNETGGELKANAPKKSTKKCTSRKSLKKGKEPPSPSTKDDISLMKENCIEIKANEKKINDDNVGMEYEYNRSKEIQTGDGVNPCNVNDAGVSNGKAVYELLEDEKKEHQMESSTYDKRNVKKSKRKYSEENVNGNDDISLHEKRNKRKKKKNSNTEDGEHITREEAKGNDNSAHKRYHNSSLRSGHNSVHKGSHISEMNGEAENEEKRQAGAELVLEKEEKEGHTGDVSTAESVYQKCAYEEEKMNDDRTYNASKGKVATKKKNLSKKKGSKVNADEFEGKKDTADVINPNDYKPVKKKYKKLLKNLQTNLSKKLMEQEGEKRIKTWGEKLTLQQKINRFIKKNIATRTEYKYGKKPNTLSICNQFNLYNHLTMLNDFNRLHYYRAAMRWTGHKDMCEGGGDPFMALCGKGETSSLHVTSTGDTTKQNSTTILAQKAVCQFNRENVHSMTNTINSYDEEVEGMLEDQNGVKNPYIFFENNKDCYVYNKKIIEIGTGPLSLLSINAILNGAKHVDALEVNKDASEMAKKLIEGYNLEDFIKIINCYSKMYVYKDEEDQRRLSKRSSLYNYFDSNVDEQHCRSFNYDLIISEVIGDFASQEGVADIYLDLHKKIFSYRKYQEYLYNWRKTNGGDNGGNNRGDNEGCYNIALQNHGEDAPTEEERPKKYAESGKNEQTGEQRGQQNVNKVEKIAYRKFAADEKLYSCEEFYNMNVKSIPYSVATYYCPVKFPYYDNIIYKSENYPERTIISPKSKLLQSVMLEWCNLSLTEEENGNTDFGTLEYLYLEQNVANQVIQKRNHIFCIEKSGPFCGFLITIDVEIRKGEHFGTKYGTCDSWYTNIVLLKDEINVNENDLVVSKTYTNLLNYNEHSIDRKTVLVSRPSYTFYGYILKSMKQSTFSVSTSDSDGHVKSSCFENSDGEDYPSNVSSCIYLDDETVLLLDQMDFHENVLAMTRRPSDGKDVTMGETKKKKNPRSVKRKKKKTNAKKIHMAKNKLNVLDEQVEEKVEDHSKVAHGSVENHCEQKGIDPIKGETHDRSERKNSLIHTRSMTKREGKGKDGSVNGNTNGNVNGSANGNANGSANGNANGSANGNANGSANGSADGSTDKSEDRSALPQDATKTNSHKDASVNNTENGKIANYEEKSPRKEAISNRDKQMRKHDNSSTSKRNQRGKRVKGYKAKSAKVEKGNTARNSGGNINSRSSPRKGAQKTSKKDPKKNAHKKRKKDKLRDENEYKKISDESTKEYGKDIVDIINNYNLNANFYYENLRDKILVYKNMKYKLLRIYEPVVIDYDEQATVIYKKEDIYSSKENNVSKFVNNVYQ
ncbi:hypothetical protein C922_02465 [Plasmodium inui San Antonio 1]|uniref:Uncharacterized protein n=1 Tax=Plasmodium inui San Antonio 1 TaxID=1237626 RepID=W7A6A0_9APIC|nr:hypothetical protein C922_02465 [Plasmodium inui San Antonio 1]EUD67315.1 hypothetical protein C922_02465 [Plasmodium inui San Antonio 1]